MSHHEVSATHYIKIWALLLVLLVVSICGPMLGIKVVTLLTAFGIAIVKAYIVAANFMHLNVEKRIISYMLLAMLGLMFVFFFGTASDVMMSHGTRWEKRVLESATEEGHEE